LRSDNHDHQRLCVASIQESDAPSNIVYQDPPGTPRNQENGFGPHLHFEVKERGVLGDYSDDASTWGYTPQPSTTAPCPGTPNMPGHPNWYGYHDPRIFITNDVALINPIPVEVTYAGNLEVRDFPSTDSRSSLVITNILPRTDGRNPAFVAYRTVVDQQNQTWYQIYLPSDYEQITQGYGASGWIAGGTYSRRSPNLLQREVTEDGFRVRRDASTNDAIARALTKVSKGQRFVVFETKDDLEGRINPATGRSYKWFRIFLPASAGSSDGYIREDGVR